MVNLDQIIAIVIFAFVASITPGPNNLMVLANATNYGFKKTIPHVLGINLGFSLMLLIVGLGVSVVFKTYPLLETIIKGLCIVFLFFLAYKIAISAKPDEKQKAKKPISFFEAVLFQWVNPKAWAMALTASSLFTMSLSLKALWVTVFFFSVVNFPCVSLWALAGSRLGVLLNDPLRLKYFNLLMAGLLIGCLVFLV